ncbi:hypothetical protein [Absidia glauca]|uniref:K Homology domain-containing protein n=1 Tax=Absidia glauca TaxID=4829 RepID=A0A163JN14_ABSGL|nr:hypothetical protein [Absidia glauca]
MPGLALVDDTTLRQKRQDLLYQHPDLVGVELTAIHASQRQLMVTLSGPTHSVLKAKSEILASDAIQVRTTIQSIHPCIISQQKKRSQLTEHLETLGKDFKVNFTIDVAVEPSITLQGTMAGVEAARIQVLVYLDQLLDLHIDSVSLPPLLHNILGGKRHYQLQSVMEETATNIYLEAPFAIGHVGLALQQQQGLVYISGDTAATKRATLLAKKLAEQKLNCLYHKESSFDPHKADWILLRQQDKLKKLLQDNGSFIHFSQIGSGSPVIQVYGENRINTERTLRLLNHMAHDIYHVTFKWKPTANDFDLMTCISRLAEFSGGEVLYSGDQGRLDVYGSDTAIRLVYQFVKDSKLMDNHISTCITLELASEHRAFMKGKKSGKVNKIVKSCGANIKFIPAYSDYNCLMTVDSTDIDKAFYGLELLSHELPEERSFYVPEIYHRRIIGVGGKNIQRIMKKYGVYVKFSGADEFTELGGYFENEHNVFARTPRKYSSSLQQLYDEVMELITFEKDRNWVSYSVKVPLYLHRTIPNLHSNALRDYGRLHNTRLWWPPRCGNADVVVVGPVTQVRLIQAALSNLLPRHCYVPVPLSSALTNYLESSIHLKNLKRVMQMDWSVALIDPDTNTKEIPATSCVQWQTSHTFINALIFQLTTTAGPSEVASGGDDDSMVITDCERRLQMAKNLLLDQLLAYNIPQTLTTKKPSGNARLMTRQKLYGPASVITQADKLGVFYTLMNTSDIPANHRHALFPGSKFNILDSNYPLPTNSAIHQSPYQIPPTSTSTIDVIVPQITKTIWSADQPNDDPWSPPLTDSPMRNQTVHGRFEMKSTDGPRPQFSNQLHHQPPFQHPLHSQIPDRRSPPTLLPNQPTPALHFPTPSFSATIKSDAPRSHFDLPSSQPTSDFDINSTNRPAAKGPYPPYLLTKFDKNDMISPSTPHSLSPMLLSNHGSASPMPFSGPFDMSLPPRKLQSPCHSYLNEAVLTPSFSSPYPR